MRVAHRLVAFALASSLLAMPTPVSRADSGVNAYATIGLLLVVVGVFGWSAWQMEKEDKADAFQSPAWLPFREPLANSAVGLSLGPDTRVDDRVIYLAGLAYGLRF
jgi:hypothetical protein